MRGEIARVVGPEYGTLVAILGAVRRALPAGPQRIAALGRLLDSPLLELVRRGAREEIDALLEKAGGEAQPFEAKYFDVLRRKPDGAWEFSHRMWSSNLPR